MNYNDLKCLPGDPYPLGGNYDGNGVNFALFSEHASGVELYLFTGEEKDDYVSVEIKEHTDNVWHIYIKGLKPGQRYGYKVNGPFDPAHGARFNPHKLLLDPYAKAIDGGITWDESLFGYPLDDEGEERDLKMCTKESTPYMDKAVVIDPAFDWEGDTPLNIPLNKTIIYETHVRGLTMLHPDLDENIRGTYKGLASDPVIDYLKKLGINAIELLPVHHFVHDKQLIDKGLSNYWGYNSIGYFAPHSGYCSSGSRGQQVTEFQEMVKAFHKAGIEVILDVVYNHTAEGNHYGPTLSFRGIDNSAYYRLVADNPRFYMDYTGTGNSLNMLHPRSLQLVMDSLRYWVTQMHIDGFRFDLASTLARGLFDVGKLSTFLDTIHQDPVVSQVKLIAEPWDIGEGGYQVGNFPILWSEWNGKYRDSVRRFWRGDERQVAELGFRLSGSSDLYKDDGRKPFASINFVTAHDGFTLQDLVSYNEKHNEANLENNQDGTSDNLSWNCGVEGETGDEEIITLRERQKRNFLATLFLSQGVPMLSSGDEYGRTQYGNNNGYCQDNEISWFNWEWTQRQQQQFEFTQMLIRLRKDTHIFTRRKFFQGREIHGSDVKDIRWLNQRGEDMSEDEWEDSVTRCLGMMLNGAWLDEYDKNGQKIKDDIYLMMVNSYWKEIVFHLPEDENSGDWECLFDTYQEAPFGGITERTCRLRPRSMVLLRKESVIDN